MLVGRIYDFQLLSILSRSFEEHRGKTQDECPRAKNGVLPQNPPGVCVDALFPPFE